MTFAIRLFITFVSMQDQREGNSNSLGKQDEHQSIEQRIENDANLVGNILCLVQVNCSHGVIFLSPQALLDCLANKNKYVGRGNEGLAKALEIVCVVFTQCFFDHQRQCLESKSTCFKDIRAKSIFTTKVDHLGIEKSLNARAYEIGF